MPIYDCRLNNEDWMTYPAATPIPPGAEPFPRFDGLAGELRDAMGQKLLWVVRCDTVTGEVEQYERIGGKFSIDPKTNRVLVVRTKYAAPLTYTAPKPKKIPEGVTSECDAELKGKASEFSIRMARLWFKKHDGKGKKLYYPPGVTNAEREQAESTQEMIDGAYIPKEVIYSKVDTVTGVFNCTDLTVPPDEPDTPFIVGG